MAIICKKHKLLYLLNPRTGGSAVAEHLVKYFEGEWLPSKDVLDENGNILLQSKHQPLESLIKFGFIDEKEVAEYVVFTNVRNPSESLISLYEKYKGRYAKWRDEGNFWVLHSGPKILAEIDYCLNHSFTEWVISRYWKSAILSMFNLRQFSVYETYTNRCNYILKKETLSADFKDMLEKCNIDGNGNIEVYNETETKKANSNTRYNLLTKLIICTTYKSDFRKYGYRFKNR